MILLLTLIILIAHPLFGMDDQSNPIHDAVKQKNLAQLNELLKKASKDEINECLESRDTPLHLACRLGYNRIATALIGAGANIHADNSDNYMTPLQEACQGGMSGPYQYAKLMPGAQENELEYAKIINLLVSNGASVCRDRNGKKYSSKPITIASMYDKRAIALALISNGLRLKHSHIYYAAIMGQTELTRMLALHKAKTDNHMDAFKILVKAVSFQGDSSKDSDDEEEDSNEVFPSSSLTSTSKS